jgi:hypothetical protein
MLFQLFSGVLVTHRTLSAISPSQFGKSAFALSRTLCALLVCFETPNPDPRCQRSTDPVLLGISLSGNRRMKSSESLTFQIPNTDVRCHVLYSTPSPWDPSPLGTHYSSVFLSTLKTPKCRIPAPRDLVPRVRAPIDGPDQIGKSRIAILTCMQLLHSPTPICRYAMANGSTRA